MQRLHCALGPRIRVAQARNEARRAQQSYAQVLVPASRWVARVAAGSLPEPSNSVAAEGELHPSAEVQPPTQTQSAPPQGVQHVPSTFFSLAATYTAAAVAFLLSLVTKLRNTQVWLRAERLQKLRQAAADEPSSADKHAAYLRELNKSSQHSTVITRVESKEHASNGAVVAEYMKALVATDKLSSYVSSSSNAQGLAAGEDHRSLAQLLKELQQQATAEQADDSPGSSLRRPLHVVVQGGQLGSAHKGMGLLQAVWFLLLAVLLLVGLGFCWLVGRQVVRGMQEARVQAASSTGVAAVAAASTPSPAASSVEPKEYKKEEVSEKEQRTFADVRGCDEAKEELREVVEFLKNPAKFTRLGAKLPKGVLLTGPPGTGKTLLARAVAGEAGVPFFYRAGSEFEELYVGVGSRRMRALFQAAKKKAPCIVFIDEIDAIGGNRKHWENHSRKTLNQLLVEMDGFESSEGVIVMAATNLAETLDAALKRPGRFDRQVAVPLPDIQGRIDILDYYLGSKPVAGEVDRDLIARQTQGFSGADLSNLVNEAALLAAKQGADLITPLMLDSSFDKIRMGVERKNVRRTAEGIKRTAYHEAGHALVAMHTPGASPVHKATIVPRGHALGMVTQVGREDEFSINKQQMLARIWVCMGGQVAEEVIFGVDQVTSGATDDLRQATEWARYMVTECGLNDAVGPMYVAESSSKQSTMSESLKQQVDEQVRLMLVEARDGVRALLRSRLPELHCLAQALQERETLTAEQIREVMAGEQLPGAGADGGAGADKPELPGHLEGVLVNVGATQGGHLGKAAA
ncbi:P-loop containing nucleoside triphosphate hydrolase protein [Haematococcus lacustris]